MIKEPLVSVLMTAYNRQEYIAPAIESVLNSTYRNFELIISDDASTDSTVAIAHQYAAKDERIKVFVHEKNIGDYPNRNRAAGYSVGFYLMHVDSDDILFEKSIQQCVELMKQYPAVHFGTYYRDPATAPFVMASEAALRRHFFETPFLMIGPGGTIIKRCYFNEIGGFPEKYGPANDMYFNLKASRFSDILMIPWTLFFLRRHPEQESMNMYSYLYNNYKYNRDSFNELDFPFKKKELEWLRKKNCRRFLFNIIKFFWKTKDFQKTKFAMKQASFGARQILAGIFN
jgi:glycosyltransferase involved in cell wall biosynthesis